MTRLFALVILCFSSVASLAATPYKTESIMLLQPDFVLTERVSSVTALSEYIKAVESACQAVLVDAQPSPAGGFLVLAVRPGGQSMTWLDFKPGLPTPLAERLKAAILRVPPFQARHGVVVFAVKASLWDAPLSHDFPSPSEWNKAMEGRGEPMEIGDLVDKVWPGRVGT